MAVKDQIFSELALLGGNFGVGGDVGRIYDRHIQPSLNGMVKHDTVKNRAGSWHETK